MLYRLVDRINDRGVRAMGSLWRWTGRARWRRWLVVTMLINLLVRSCVAK